MTEATSSTITVAIATLGRAEPLDRCLTALSRQNRPVDSVIIGDQNPDETAEGVATRYRSELPIRVLDRPESETTPATRNRLLDAAETDIIAYLDDDTEPDPQWSQTIVDGYHHEKEPKAVGGPAITVDPDGTRVVDVLRTPENQNKINRYGEIKSAYDRWIPPEPTETDLLIGANMSFDVETLRDVGGFDPDYGAAQAGEEFPPMVAIAQNGHSLLYHPDALVKHYEAPYGGHRAAYEDDKSRIYWDGRHLIRLRWYYLRDTFWLGLVRLVFWTEYGPPPVWKLLGGSIIEGSTGPLYWIAGYIDGLRYETELLGY